MGLRGIISGGRLNFIRKWLYWSTPAGIFGAVVRLLLELMSFMVLLGVTPYMVLFMLVLGCLDFFYLLETRAVLKRLKNKEQILPEDEKSMFMPNGSPASKKNVNLWQFVVMFLVFLLNLAYAADGMYIIFFTLTAWH